MPREAECIADWNGARAEVKAVLEARELILRSGVRRKIPFVAMKNIKVNNDHLTFEFDGNKCSLLLGSTIAASWAKTFQAPPPSLAKKMGIHAEMAVEVTGVVDDGALQDALGEARQIVKTGGDLIVARVDSGAALAGILKQKSKTLENGIPMWVVFRKGKAQALTENMVRELCLATGIVDNKVAAVSAMLTALRFVKRRKPATR
jgi:hypothetical protein